jgi:tetratricopeptide (TPR) repeat protein
MMKTTIALLAVLLSGVAAIGCAASKPQSPAPTIPTDEDLRKARALAEQAQAAMVKGEHGRAIQLFNQAIQLRPDLGSAWNNLGLALWDRGTDLDYIQAAEAFRRAADLLPTDERPYHNLGVLYDERGFADEAHRYFNLALERNPNSVDSLRGSVRAAKLLLKSDEEGLARVSRALMIETDPKWREIQEFERLRIQHDLAERTASPTK